MWACSSRSWKERFAASTPFRSMPTPKTQLNFKHWEAQRGSIKRSEWMGTQGSHGSVATSPVWHRDNPNKLGSHSPDHGVCRQKTVPRSSLTRHGLKQHSAGNPGSILQCSPCLPGNPPQLGGEVSSQELPEMSPGAAHLHSHPAAGRFSAMPCRLQGWRYWSRLWLGDAAMLLLICFLREMTKQKSFLQDRGDFFLSSYTI